MNVDIRFNEEILEELKKLKIYSDYAGSALFILFALYEQKQSLLDKFDDSNKERRVIILYRQLERRDLLIADERGKNLYKLTDKATKLVEFVKSHNSKEIHAETFVEKEDVLVVKPEQSSTFIEDYIAIFPKKFRDHKISVRSRMEEFIELFKYSEETILKATKAYIKEQENSETGHQFTQRSIYFIVKGIGKSKNYHLAKWCQDVENAAPTVDTSIMDSV